LSPTCPSRGSLKHWRCRGTPPTTRPCRGPPGPDRRPDPVDDVHVLGVDEHVWRHTRRGDKYVTVIIDVTSIRDGTGPARLLDMVPGRSKQAFKTWLATRPESFRAGLEVVAMDGFTGFKTATTEELPDAVAVMDPFPRRAPGRRRTGPVPAPRPAGPARSPRPRRGPALPGPAHPAHRSRPAHRPTARTHPSPVRYRGTRRGRDDLGGLPGGDRRLPPPRPGQRPGDDDQGDCVRQARRPGRAERGHHPGPDPEEALCGRPSLLRAPRTSNGPTEAINVRLEHILGTALGFRNLTHYIARSLLATGGFRPQLHPQLR